MLFDLTHTRTHNLIRHQMPTIIYCDFDAGVEAHRPDAKARIVSSGNADNYWMIALKRLQLFVYTPFHEASMPGTIPGPWNAEFLFSFNDRWEPSYRYVVDDHYRCNHSYMYCRRQHLQRIDCRRGRCEARPIGHCSRGPCAQEPPIKQSNRMLGKGGKEVKFSSLDQGWSDLDKKVCRAMLMSRSPFSQYWPRICPKSEESCILVPENYTKIASGNFVNCPWGV